VPDSSLNLQPQSLGEQVAEAMREAILVGKLAPGAALRETTLARELSVARNTIREALRILAGERLVTFHVHRGAVVSTLTEQDVVDLYGVRALLEPAALRNSKDHRAEDFQSVVDAVHDLEDATKQSNLRTVVERDLNFHKSIVALQNSSRLNEFFNDVCAEVRRCTMLVIFAHEDHRPRSPNVEEHRRIANALVELRYQDAADLALAHVEATRDQAIDLIRSEQVHVGGKHSSSEMSVRKAPGQNRSQNARVLDVPGEIAHVTT
jgi:DNA-binding GntR family transcriptional regulator